MPLSSRSGPGPLPPAPTGRPLAHALIAALAQASISGLHGAQWAQLALALASVGMRREEMRLDVGRAIWAVVVLALKFKFEFAPKFALAAVLQGPGVPPALVLVASPSPVFAS